MEILIAKGNYNGEQNLIQLHIMFAKTRMQINNSSTSARTRSLVVLLKNPRRESKIKGPGNNRIRRQVRSTWLIIEDEEYKKDFMLHLNTAYTYR